MGEDNTKQQVFMASKKKRSENTAPDTSYYMRLHEQ